SLGRWTTNSCPAKSTAMGCGSRPAAVGGVNSKVSTWAHLSCRGSRWVRPTRQQPAVSCHRIGFGVRARRVLLGDRDAAGRGGGPGAENGAPQEQLIAALRCRVITMQAGEAGCWRTRRRSRSEERRVGKASTGRGSGEGEGRREATACI